MTFVFYSLRLHRGHLLGRQESHDEILDIYYLFNRYYTHIRLYVLHKIVM